MAKLTFLGAAGSVTGSKYLVEAAGKRLLVDCGIFQGSQELQDRNYKPLPADPKTIDYLVLTHAIVNRLRIRRVAAGACEIGLSRAHLCKSGSHRAYDHPTEGLRSS